MLRHVNFEHLAFEDIPLDRDIYLMDERWLGDYEREWTKAFAGDATADTHIGYVIPVAARSIGDEWIEFSWYPNYADRFHEVPIFLPKSDFVACVDLWKYDEKPRVFVRSKWATDTHERPLVAFAFVDAVGIKNLLKSGKLDSAALVHLRRLIDEIAARYPNFAFISFADSLLVKQAWSVGHVGSPITYTYSPEALLPVVADLMAAISAALGVRAYAALAQGINAYGDREVLHMSPSGNHISLNSLGTPFAQVLAIEVAAHAALRDGTHPPAELYLDAMLFRSLKLKFEYDKSRVTLYPYRSPMTGSKRSAYVAVSMQDMIDNL